LADRGNGQYHSIGMTSFRITLRQHQAKLVSLAIGYHLARPGSEIDHGTMSAYKHGLAELAPMVEAQLEEAQAVFDLSPLQGMLLSTAFSSTLSELKMYSVFDRMAGDSRRPRSTAPGFDDHLRELFPAIAGDPSYASRLAEDMAMLRREMPFARARELYELERQAAELARQQRKPWQFWKRA
jgi:hypothetical protein